MSDTRTSTAPVADSALRERMWRQPALPPGAFAALNAGVAPAPSGVTRDSLYETALRLCREYGTQAAEEKFFAPLSRDVTSRFSDSQLGDIFDAAAREAAHEKGAQHAEIDEGGDGPARPGPAVGTMDAGAAGVIDSSPPTDENPLISLDYIQSLTPKPRDYLVTPFFVSGELGLIYAQWKAMKTFFALSLALAIAAGQKWLGEFVVPRPRRVLYIDEEMPQDELVRRAKRLSVGLRTRNFRALSRQGLTFGSANDAECLLAKFQSWGFDPEVVFIDSFRAVSPGNEKEANEVRAVWKSVVPLLKGRTVIFVHHMKKPPQVGRADIRHAASGSTDLMAGPDVALAIQRTAQNLLLVENPACRHQVEAKPFAVLVKDIGNKTDLLFGGYNTARQSKLQAAQAKAVAFALAARRKVSTADIQAAVKTAHAAVADRTIERALKAAEKAGQLRSEGKGFWIANAPQKRAACTPTLSAIRQYIECDLTADAEDGRRSPSGWTAVASSGASAQELQRAQVKGAAITHEDCRK